MIRLPLTTEEMLTHGSKSSRKILVDVFRYYREKLMMTNSLYSCPNVIHLYPMGKWARTYEISIPPRSRVKFSMMFLWFPPWVFFFSLYYIIYFISLFSLLFLFFPFRIVETIRKILFDFCSIIEHRNFYSFKIYLLSMICFLDSDVIANYIFH